MLHTDRMTIIYDLDLKIDRGLLDAIWYSDIKGNCRNLKTFEKLSGNDCVTHR